MTYHTASFVVVVVVAVAVAMVKDVATVLYHCGRDVVINLATGI